MKKRRLLFLIVNLVAVLTALGSTFLPWWRGARPSDVALTEILPLDFLNNFGFSPSVVVAIFVGAVIMLIGAILAFKLVVLGGTIINIITASLYFLTFHIGWQPGEYGHGLYLLAASVAMVAVSMLIPRRKERKG